MLYFSALCGLDKVLLPLNEAFCDRRQKECLFHALERRLTGRYVSRYELVSFTTMPYSQIAGRIRRQNLALLAGAAALAAGGAWAVRRLLRRSVGEF